MYSNNVKKKSITMDRFDLVDKLLSARSNTSITEEEFNIFVKAYEETIIDDMSQDKYSSTIKISSTQRTVFNIA